ncbi:PREDICTED: ankyrin-3 isoform X2 [Thamnophis sirtalis]|uniref:Ankyrin-3 isoform X2 n=1 Tax=Thamnophis sirtalis TaxID=35019 RepID=A0A6I9WX29_9SAUR|nr:PREDICTED: ankyrin-3 isoform X2 [Thamnophis sirtalis]
MYVYQKDLSQGDVEKQEALPCSDEQGQPEEEELTAEESLHSYLESSRVNTPVSQEEDSRPSSAQLMSDDSYKTLKLLSQHSVEYHDDELSELRGESYRFAEKMLLSEKLDVSYSDTEESVTDHVPPLSSDFQGPDKRSREKIATVSPQDILTKISKEISENGVGKMSKDDPYEKVTVLHYSGDVSSPKHAMWMRFAENRLDRGREKLMYEDRVDRTVKEAEEKLTEVSQFFRDKTEKLNDELQSPKKQQKRNGREAGVGLRSASSSPEKVTASESQGDWAGGGGVCAQDGKGWPKPEERKAASLPSSPERQILSHPRKDLKGAAQKSKIPEALPTGFQLKQSKLSSIRLKFEQSLGSKSKEMLPEEKKLDAPSKIPVKKLQDSKLPVSQFYSREKQAKEVDLVNGNLTLQKEPPAGCFQDGPRGKGKVIEDAPPLKVPKAKDEIPSNTVSALAEQKVKGLAYGASAVPVPAKGHWDKKIYRTWESPGTSSHKAQREKLSHVLVQDVVNENQIDPLETKDLAKSGELITVTEYEQKVSTNGSGSKEVKEVTVKSPSKKVLYREYLVREGDYPTEVRDRIAKKKEPVMAAHIPESVSEEQSILVGGVPEGQPPNARHELPTRVPHVRMDKEKVEGQFDGTEQKKGVEYSPTSTRQLSCFQLSPPQGEAKSSPSKTPDSLEVSPGKLSPAKKFDLMKPSPLATEDAAKEIKTLPVYVSFVQVGRQYEREVQQGTIKKIVSQESKTVQETRGGFYTTRPQKQLPSPQGSPEDDTLEQVSFMDSSGKSPLTPETPSSEEVSYEFTSKTPDSLIAYIPGKPSPIPEVSEESEEEAEAKSTSIKQSPPTEQELPNNNLDRESNKRPKGNRVAYIEFPPPPPLDADHSEPEKLRPSSESDMELTEVNLQDELERRQLAEPVIRVQPPSPVPPAEDLSDSSDDESLYQPVPIKRYMFKLNDIEDDWKEATTRKFSGTEARKANEFDLAHESPQNDVAPNGNNDQSITECSIATTAEFSHDTDATEIDSLDGYDLQDEDDGLTESDSKQAYPAVETKKDLWVTEGILKQTDRSFSQSKLEIIEEEEKVSSEEKKKPLSKCPAAEKNVDKAEQKSGAQFFTLEGRHPDRTVFPDTYFSYKVDEEFATPFKTIATKSLDFDPWSSNRGDDEVFESKSRDDDTKPFGLAVEDRSPATTPDTTPARTPTDESTPTSEPNPFPFHEGKMFEMTRSGAIDMSKRDFVEERLQFFQIGPQSPCERTDIRMAIVADHLGLSWTELARELNFSVDEINQIRVENPNSLIAQSFMLLKKWVTRDGKNATTDALTSVLTKINRIDIVTLLEGPIFDYGNISGTRSFADENNVFHDTVDGYPTFQMELETPPGLCFAPPSHFHQDDLASDFSSIESPFRTPSRLSDVLATSQGNLEETAAGPPVVIEEDISLEDGRYDYSVPLEGASKDGGQNPLEEIHLKDYPRYLGSYAGMQTPSDSSQPLVRTERHERNWSGADEEPTDKKLKSLFEDICLEEIAESEEMTEEKALSILKYVQQAEQEMSSIAGWQNEAPRVKVEPTSSGRRISGELLNRLDDSPGQCRDSITSYFKGEAGKLETNGSYSESTLEAKGKTFVQDSVNSQGKQSDKETVKPKMQSSLRTEQQTISLTSHHKSLQEASKPAVDTPKTSVPVSMKKTSWNISDSSKPRSKAQEDDGTAAASEQKGEEAKNIPGESVTREQFTDEEGNTVTRKVTRKVLRRLVIPHVKKPIRGEGCKVKMKKDARHAEKTTYS